MVKNIVIWVFGFAIAVIAGLTAMGAIAKNKAPSLAVTIYPVNGFAAEKLAATAIKDAIAKNLGQFPDRVTPSITLLAQKAFIAEPATPEAIAVLALSKADNSKRKMMQHAFLLSRREPIVTGWMIADSGAREDVPALLNHYDSMLRTNTSAASVVIPVMAGALTNDNFVAPFTSLLKKQPPWANQFWAAVVGKPDSLGNAVLLRSKLYKPAENDEAYRDADLIRALISNQQFAQAGDLYDLLVDEKNTNNLVKNGSFVAESLYSPLDWQLFSTGEYGAVITGGKLELSAIRNSGGLFARQLVKLPSRILALEVGTGSSKNYPVPVFVTLTCAQTMNNAPQAIRIPVKTKIDNLQINNSQSGCSFYWLDISGRASETGDGFDIALDSIALR